MAIAKIDLRDFPPALRRLVRTWYEWREIELYTSEEGLGQLSCDPATPEYWRTLPPEMRSDNEFHIGDGDSGEFLVSEDGVFYLGAEQRGSRNRRCMFRRFDDIEKYLLFNIGNTAMLASDLEFPSRKFYMQGVRPGVTAVNPDPSRYSDRFSVTFDGESTDRGWMGWRDAIMFSHIAPLSYEALDAKLREGVPPEWFTLELAEA